MTDRIALYGAPGSPYTRMMPAALRYRRRRAKRLGRLRQARAGLAGLFA